MWKYNVILPAFFACVAVMLVACGGGSKEVAVALSDLTSDLEKEGFSFRTEKISQDDLQSVAALEGVGIKVGDMDILLIRLTILPRGGFTGMRLLGVNKEAALDRGTERYRVLVDSRSEHYDAATFDSVLSALKKSYLARTE